MLSTLNQCVNVAYPHYSSRYKLVKIAPSKRDFTLTFRYRNRFAHFKIRQFNFEKNTKYFAKYLVFAGRVKVWIEREDGTVAYGIKPKKKWILQMAVKKALKYI